MDALISEEEMVLYHRFMDESQLGLAVYKGK